MIVFSLDIDWAPEPLIEDTLELFSSHGVKCTVFATHDSAAVRGCDRDLFEVGIHPNFNPLLDGAGQSSAQAVLDNLLNLFPEAKGVRSHSLLHSTRLLAEFSRRGLVYEANQLLPYHQSLSLFRHWTGLMRIPFNWEDDVHFSYRRPYSDPGLELNGSSLNVFNFHPVHVFLNTDTQERYDAAHPFTQKPAELAAFRNRDSTGTRDLLIRLLQDCRDRREGRRTLLELAKSALDRPAVQAHAHR